MKAGATRCALLICVMTVQALLWHVHPVQALYEDQVGEFDWTVENLGRANVVVFGGSDKRGALRGSARAMYVVSDERSRALARVDSKTGAIKWRRLFGEGDHVQNIEQTNYGLLSVSGACKNLRMWDLGDGTLEWDAIAYTGERVCDDVRLHAVGDDRVLVLSTSYALLVDLKNGKIQWNTELSSMELNALRSSHVVSDAKKLYVLGQKQQEAVLFSLEIQQGALNKAEASALEAVQVLLRDAEKDSDRVLAVAMDAKAIKIQALDQEGVETTALSSLELPSEAVALETTMSSELVLHLRSGQRVFCRVSDSKQVEKVALFARDSVLVEPQGDGPSLFHIQTADAGKRVHVASYNRQSSSPVVEWDAEFDLSIHGGQVEQAFVGCQSKKKENALPRCRALLVLADDGLLMTVPEDGSERDGVREEETKNVAWVREEALANVKEVHWITPAETEMEKQPMTGIPSFGEELALEMKRAKMLFDHMVAFSSSVLGDGARGRGSRSDARTEPVNSHFFGFSKYILLLTDSGRLFAIRAETNEVAWSKFVGPDYRLFVLRDHPALGSGAELLLVSDSAGMIWLDGDNGREIEVVGKDDTKLGEEIWTVLLPKRKHHAGDDEIAVRRGVARISSSSLDVEIFPRGGNAQLPELDNFFFHRYDNATKSFQGFKIEQGNNGQYHAHQVWSFVLSDEHTLAATSHQMDKLVIDSAVATTGDDSLLLKYLNPHMFGIAVVSKERVDGQDDPVPVLHVNLVDAVTGRVIHRVQHVHGSGPVQMVQNAHWVVYSFWNTKEKRTEIVQMLLYEGAVGKHQLNPWRRPAWNDWRSSFDPRPPFVLQKSFVYPSRIRTLASTITARGITPQFLLVGMENGQIYKLGRGWINPRQTEKPPTEEEQSEGLMQYTPLVPVYNHPTQMITYNKTIGQLKHISTFPAELESTTLVFAHGLDIHYARISPAKSFDLLPSDFNYEMLVLLCIGFLVATVVSRKLARRKALLEAWK